MKKKIFTLIIAATFSSAEASSQTIKDNLDKLAKDKSTVDRAAKADVLIHTKTISDSTQIKTAPVNKEVDKIKSKKYKYKKKVSHLQNKMSH